MTRLRYAAAAVLLVALGACGGEDADSQDGPTASPTGTSTGSGTTGPSATPPSGSSPSESDAPSLPSGGPASDPAPLEATTRLLDWRPVGGSVRDTVTRSGAWTLTVPHGGAGYRLHGPGTSSGSGVSGTRVSDALIDGRWAVVVLQDKAEQHPSTAEVTDLTSGESFRIDGRSDVPTVSGGTWALGDDRVLHAAVGPGRSYCTATVDLRTRRSTLGWCAPKRHGFNDARLTPGGDSVLGFDDSRPSCRTLLALDGDRATPFEGVPDCTAWDGLLTQDGAVWSVIPNEHRVEEGHFYARQGDGYYDLGPGTAGSLVWCHDAAYFARDPERDGEPATLLRWAPADGLSVAYRSPAGQAFLSEPRCGGDTITVTALAQAGDEQVSAALD